ncbi:MAG: hypothetical protein ACI861_001428 [Paracoccaceae bacterium]|jgi:hypothetical protein
MKTAFLIFAFVIIGFFLFVRFAPSSPATWHVDPMTAKKGRKKNVFIQLPYTGKHRSPVFAMDAAALARSYDDLILSRNNVTKLAGDADAGFVTYVARSKMMRYPDYISIKFIDLGERRSTIAVFSRARFGYSDRGVNRRRFLAWQKKITG